MRVEVSIVVRLKKIRMQRKALVPYIRGSLGRVAQLVEQRTENPRVGGSIPSPTTRKKSKSLANKILARGLFFYVGTESGANAA